VGGSVTVAPGGHLFFPECAGRGDSCALTVVWLSGRESVVVASLREVAIVLCEAIAPNTFLREVPPTTAVSSSAGALASADADLLSISTDARSSLKNLGAGIFSDGVMASIAPSIASSPLPQVPGFPS